VRTLPVMTERIAMLENLLFTVPGPKMLWQFGELAYDFPINYCEDGNIDPGCRTSPKPIRWDYFNDPFRHKLHDVTAALLTLRKNHEVFETSNFQLNIASGQVRSIFLSHPDLNVGVFANVGVTATTVSNPAFQHIGEWYEYYTGDTLLVTSGVPTSFALAPGEYRLYLDKYVPLPPGVVISKAGEPSGAVAFADLRPNPAGDAFFVNFSLRENADIRLDITDVAGKSIQNQHFGNLPAGEHQFQVESAHWSPGIYFVTLRDHHGAVSAKKLVKW
jgi:hypothetical protein